MPLRQPLATQARPTCRPGHPAPPVMTAVVGWGEKRVLGWLGIPGSAPPVVTLILAMGILTPATAVLVVGRREAGRCGIDGKNSNNTATSSAATSGKSHSSMILAETSATRAGKRGALGVGTSKTPRSAEPDQRENGDDAGYAWALF